MVDWEKVNEKPVPKIQEKIEGLGPIPSGKIEKSSSSEPAEVTALVSGAGVYRSIGLISFLKAMSIRKKSLNILVGHDLSSIVLAYYSLGFKPDYIEWKFFKFLKENRDRRVYSAEWLDSVRLMLLKDLEKFNIEDGKITLLIPIWNESENKVEYLKRGSLEKALMANIDPYNRMKIKVGPAYAKSFLPERVLKTLGVNKIIALDFLSEKLRWKMGDGYLNGTFQKAASIQKKAKVLVEKVKYIEFPLSEFYLDDAAKLPDIVHKSKKFVRSLPELFGESEKL